MDSPLWFGERLKIRHRLRRNTVCSEYFTILPGRTFPVYDRFSKITINVALSPSPIGTWALGVLATMAAKTSGQRRRRKTFRTDANGEIAFASNARVFPHHRRKLSRDTLARLSFDVLSHVILKSAFTHCSVSLLRSFAPRLSF